MPSSRATPSPSITLGCTLQPPLWPSHLGHFPRPLISHWPHIQTQTHQPDYIGALPTIPSPCPTTARPTLIHPRLCAFSCALHPLHPCRGQLPTLVHPSIRHLCTKVWPHFLGQCLPALFFSDTTARQHKCLGPSHRRASQQRQHLAATLSPQPSPAACSLQFTLDIRAHAPRQHAPSSTMDICSPITCLSHSKHRGSIPAAPFLRRHSSTTAPVCPSPMIQALVAAILPILPHEMRLTQATIPASRC